MGKERGKGKVSFKKVVMGNVNYESENDFWAEKKLRIMEIFEKDWMKKIIGWQRYLRMIG